MRLLLFLLLAATVFSQPFTTLATFNGANGSYPNGIILGSDGNYYGSTLAGGATGNGAIFKMTPSGTLTTLYSLTQTASEQDGQRPIGNLLQVADGSFYGVTNNGGAGISNNGTIFRITSAGSFTKLYDFSTAAQYPYLGSPTAGLTLGADGNYYGVSAGGGPGGGAIFRMTPQLGMSLISGFGTENWPSQPLVLGADGNLYGIIGIAPYSNTWLFRVSKGGTYSVVYPYILGNYAPGSNLVLGSDGNLYGILANLGGALNGDVSSFFKLTPSGAFTTIATPSDLLNAGRVSLIQGKDWNFYGASVAGGATGNGMIFRMTPTGTVTVLYSFCTQSGCPDSSWPNSLIQAPDGSLIGTTTAGNGPGTIFRFQLPAPTNCAAAAPPAITSIESASAYGGYPYFGSGSWLEIKGTNMVDPSDPRLTAAVNPGQWTASDFNGLNAPTSLDGNSVSINNKPAYVWYISTTQLNVQAPEDSATGNVSIIATNCQGNSAPYTFTNQGLAPGLLAPSNYSSNGTQYLVATFASDGAYVLNTSLGASFGLNSRPAKPGDIIVAYGIGFGPVNPGGSPGVIVTESNTLYLNTVTFSFGSMPAVLSYQGLAENFVGLYEFFITVPNLPAGDI